MFIPSMVLKQLYTFGSLKNLNGNLDFSIKNRLSDAQLTELTAVRVNGQEIPLASVLLHLENEQTFAPHQISEKQPISFPLRAIVRLSLERMTLPNGKHKIEIQFRCHPFGKLKLEVEDAIAPADERTVRIPRDARDDFSAEAVQARLAFVEQYSGAKLEHTGRFSFDSHLAKGNCEHFTGAAQIPLGFAGPIKINGEHARGEFLIPLATSEGTLVASYNRGSKLVNLCGGVKTTVMSDAMQRAPVFVFDDARQCREFVKWVDKNIEKIREEAEATSHFARMLYIDPYTANKFVYLRFNYTTGDAAGQNMVGRATFAACSWIMDRYPGIKHFYLESNFATDKKASQVNIMRTRGKRVTAEAVIKREHLTTHMRVEPEMLAYHWGVATVGTFLSGANNNGLHSANAIAAMFIATGQDVANVSESSAGIIYPEVTPEGDLYISLTIPSLIVATHGGGTTLPTQKECLEVLGCTGKGKVNKLAEIIAGVALAGEISLASAISSSDWVSSHEMYGRNR